MIKRAKLRGKQLDDDCREAHTTQGMYGNNDKRVFCYGLMDAMTDEYFEKCKICGAFADNAEPMEGSGEDEKEDGGKERWLNT